MFPRLLGAALLLGSLACESGKAPPRLLVLVSIDTLRADHLGLYGYARGTSPVVDALGPESTVFDQAMTSSPWTLPAHATLLTGLYPSRHGLISHEHYLSSRLTTLAQRMSRAGYRTAAVVNSHNLGPEFGLDRGFQQYRYVEEQADRREPSTEITDQGMEWIRSAGKSPLFLFLHYYDVHSDYASLPRYEAEFRRPYEGIADGSTAQLALYREGKVSLSPADAGNLIDRYDAGIRQMDAEIGRLLDFLREASLSEETLLVLTSDHGEEFFEHGGVLHGQTQYQEVLRVPLLFRGPGVPRGLRVHDPVSLVDVVPTLLALTGIGAPQDLDGSDVAPLWSGENRNLEERFLFSEADHNNVEEDITRSVRQGRFKLLYNRLSRERRLYDLELDPGERVDVFSEQDEAAAALSERLESFLASGRIEAPARTLSQREIEKLRSLGYLR